MGPVFRPAVGRGYGRVVVDMQGRRSGNLERRNAPDVEDGDGVDAAGCLCSASSLDHDRFDRGPSKCLAADIDVHARGFSELFPTERAAGLESDTLAAAP